MPQSLQATIEVRAGVLPGQSMPEHQRFWNWTSEQQERLINGDAKAKEEWVAMAGSSREYAATLENPAILNWVERIWVWY